MRPSWRCLKAAGALVIGKTNLDQFATGLVGVRTPHPIPRNAIDPSLVPGGSSSGSAVATARGIVSFALGTDTAGSGRIPAGLNNIVGLKPSVGALSAAGVVPACRTLDCVSVFALTVEDAYKVLCRRGAARSGGSLFANLRAAPACGAARPSSPSACRPRATCKFFGDEAMRSGFEAALAGPEGMGCRIVELPFADFYAVGKPSLRGRLGGGALCRHCGLHGREGRRAFIR